MSCHDRRHRRAGGVHRRRAAVHHEPGRPVQARDRHGRATSTASPAWRSRSSPPSALAVDRRHRSRRRWPLLVGAIVDRRRASACGGPGVVEMTAMPELIAILHSFVGLAAVLVGWNSYLDVEATATAPRPRPAGSAARHPPRRGVHRCVHRRGHLHRLDRRVPQAVRRGSGPAR